MSDIVKLAEEYQKRAWAVVEDAGLIRNWESVGARANLVGSLKTGLLMKKLDIDIHVYSNPFRTCDSFEAMARIAGNPRIKKITYANLLAEEDMCLEWHAFYEDALGDEWQIDMIHIHNDSRYAGFFEKVAERISAVLTAEQKIAILTIKNSIPDDMKVMAVKSAIPDGKKVMGIEIYKAVIQDGIRTYSEFMEWKERQPGTGIMTWMP